MNRSVAFNTFINFLNSKKIRYVILGDTRAYPQQIGSDVDLVIDKRSYLQIRKIITEFCVQYNFSIIQKIQHERNATQYVIAHAAKDYYIFLQLDFCYDYTRSGRDYLKGSTLLNNITAAPNGAFNILAPSYSFIYYFMKKVEKGNINCNQFAFLKSAYDADTAGTIKVLKILFSEITAGKVSEIFKKNDIELFQSQIKIFQKELLSKGNSVKAKTGELVRKIKRILQPTGLIIGILGRDGTGKSTLIKHLEPEMSFVFPKINYYHLYPGLILNNKKKDDFSTPHKKKKRSGTASLLKLILFYLEYTLGYWYKLYPKKVKSSLIIMDRYFVDMYADPERYRSSSSKHLIWFIHKLMPKPDLWIILDASTEAVFKRKQEVEFAVSEKQRKNYLELSTKLKDAHVLDTERDIKEEVLSATEIITKKLSLKFYEKN